MTLAWTQAQVQLHHLGIGADEAHLFQRLANHVLYSDPTLRPPSEIAQARRRRGLDALGARHFRRSADRPGPHRGDRRSRDRPAAAARPRILADEAACRRSRDPERAAAVLRPGSAGRARGAGAGEPVAAETGGGRLRAARSSSCAPIWSRPKLRDLLQTAARRCCVGRSRQPGRAGQTRAGAEPPVAPPPRRSPASTPSQRRYAAAPGAGILQRPRRLCRRRTGICDDPRGGTIDAGALDQRHRQPVLRLPGLGRGQRLYLVGQQPAEPASRPGRTIRSAMRRAR